MRGTRRTRGSPRQGAWNATSARRTGAYLRTCSQKVRLAAISIAAKTSSLQTTRSSRTFRTHRTQITTEFNFIVYRADHDVGLVQLDVVPASHREDLL